MNKIFFSWQSDKPEYSDFVKKCIIKAIADLDDWELETASRDEGGADDIGILILDRIEASDLFIGDVSLVGEYPIAEKDKDGNNRTRATANPNVIYEVGYALKALTKDRVILLAAKESTPETKELPFDLRNRRTMIRQFDETKVDSQARELKQIILQDRPPIKLKEPVIFVLHIGGWTTDNSGTNAITFFICNEEPSRYTLESIEIDGQSTQANRSLEANGAETKVVLANLPIPPYNTPVESVSFIVSRLGEKYRITQRIIVESRNDQRFGIGGVEPSPQTIEHLH